jgi:hypothetical protein
MEVPLVRPYPIESRAKSMLPGDRERPY